MPATISTRRPPRRRGTQYAAALRLLRRSSLEYWVVRSSRTTTAVLGRPLRAGPKLHAALVFASWMARQTRSGVSGMLISLTPYSDSASITALTTVERLPAQPASPQPLVPSGLDLAGTG